MVNACSPSNMPRLAVWRAAAAGGGKAVPGTRQPAPAGPAALLGGRPCTRRLWGGGDGATVPGQAVWPGPPGPL